MKLNIIKSRMRVNFIFIFIVIAIMLSCAFSLHSKAAVPGGIISDGVYALKNKQTGYYLDIQYNSPNVEMHIQQYNYGTTPSTKEIL